MKKLTACILMLLMLCSCYSTPDWLIERYPEAKITRVSGGYEVVSDNVDTSGMSPNQIGIVNKPVYSTLDEVRAMPSTIIFRGRKTDQSRQLLFYKARSGVSNPIKGYTECLVEVTEVSSGDMQGLKKGDLVAVHCDYYVRIEENGEKTLCYCSDLPWSNEELTYCVVASGEQSLYGTQQYYKRFMTKERP